MTRRPFTGPRPRTEPLARGYHIARALVEPLAPPDPELIEVDAPPEPASTADVYLFDSIGGWGGVSADDFVRDVAALDVEQIVLHLNSPGGDALEGVAIANVLRAHKARVVVRVDGLAASAASVVAMAGDEVVMGLGSQLMIHDAWGWASGDAADLDSYARRLSSTSDSLAATYAAKAGGTAEEWRAVMQAEAWYTADEAVTAGLADRAAAADETGTASGEQITPGGYYGGWWSMWDSLRDPERFDLSAYAHAGRDRAPAPPIPDRTIPAAFAAGRNQQERGRAVAFSDEQLTTIRQKLGVADDADEQTITDALTEALDEQPEPAAAALPDGVSTIDTAQLEELRAAANLGREAHARQAREDREALVAAAVADGRIAPARRAAWLTQLEADPGAAATLASLEKGLIPIDPIGHSDSGDSLADDLYASVFGKES